MYGRVLQFLACADCDDDALVFFGCGHFETGFGWDVDWVDVCVLLLLLLLLL